MNISLRFLGRSFLVPSSSTLRANDVLLPPKLTKVWYRYGQSEETPAPGRETRVVLEIRTQPRLDEPFALPKLSSGLLLPAKSTATTRLRSTSTNFYANCFLIPILKASGKIYPQRGTLSYTLFDTLPN